MNVFLTFDVEIWCGGWERLDERFPAAFERYVYGRSAAGDYALPKTLEILARHGLHGIFFVEPLFAARFGVEYLQRICALIVAAGQEIQLHLHPEWTDEIRPPVFPARPYKRQHLIEYDRDEQHALIVRGRTLLEAAAGTTVTAFRAGSFAANADTLAALHTAGIGIDASINVTAALSGRALEQRARLTVPQRRGALCLVPMSVFRDGFGRLRHAQIGACAWPELRAALLDAERLGYSAFTVLAHNFELLRSGSSQPDFWVVQRFERLCAFLSAQRARLPTGSLTAPPGCDPLATHPEIPRVGSGATLLRYYEQARRRLG